ncbi:S8 family serine peptidase [Corynebacterium sp. HS2168-gen11]|uniref:S8 family serine peptidase n=1 Tax=Corynebacterium sp. HS2168-gen11 TaxID=2974027 RepID=UPI00216ABD2D|nr:S8 family serine peptidase [Corynebacterium sp. HS2168-gen11]MCS4535654.1 S8 family serine peptidase [Corynebacterium sp. HS2168-gen11]
MTVALVMLYCSPPAIAQDQPHSPQPSPCQRVVPATADDISAQARMADMWRAAHKLATGAGVTVAVIDTGVSPHPRLGHVLDGGDFVHDSATGGTIDCDAHGTIVAGIIATRPHPTDDLVGIAPEATILSIKQTSAFGNSEHENEGSILTLVTALRRALELHATIINISLVSCFAHPPHPADIAQLQEVLATAEEQNVLVIAASGNTSANCDAHSYVLPAHLETVLAVSAVTMHHTQADFALPAPAPTLSAPGVFSAALDPYTEGLIAGLAYANDQVPLAGTSFAAPIISGAAALLAQRFPAATAAQLRNMLLAHSDPATHVFNIAHLVQILPAADPKSAGLVPTQSESTLPTHIRPDTIQPSQLTGVGVWLSALSIVVTVLVYRRREAVASMSENSVHNGIHHR